jgi:hypothetical protein
MAEQEEIEVNFRLDPEGRTALSSSQDCSSVIDYTTKVIATHFVDPPDDANRQACSSSLYNELLLDCEIADSGLMPRTFWVPAAADSFQPRCTLEQMARDIFLHHTARCGDNSFDPEQSGAEWWVQLRPSPEITGRYSMHGSNDDEYERNGICFHWDKDEDLRLLCGGTVYVHPHLSTVTYLTAIGAPTIVAEGFRINNLSGEWIPPVDLEPSNDGAATTDEASRVAAFVSWPAVGKHLSFDGRYLHAAPFDLQQPGAFAKQYQVPVDTDKVQRRRYRRCTFLVNIWLNHKPFNVNPFPDTMIDKLSGYELSPGTESKTTSRRTHLSFTDNNKHVGTGSSRVTVVTVRSDKTLDVEEINGRSSPSAAAADTATGKICPVEQFTIPLALVRAKANEGGSVRIQWQLKKGSGSENLGMFLGKQAIHNEPNSKRPRVDVPS